MPSSRLELQQGLVYATHSPKDFALGLSSLKDIIAGNLPAKLNIILSKKVFKYYRNPSTRLRWVVSLRDAYETSLVKRLVKQFHFS